MSRFRRTEFLSRQYRWPGFLLILGMLAGSLLLVLASPPPTRAHTHECGGIVELYAELYPHDLTVRGLGALELSERVAEAHNDQLEGVPRNVFGGLHRFRDRNGINGRAQVPKEVCARLDLERDLSGLWRVAVALGLALFVITLVWGGFMLMVETTGMVQPGRTRVMMLSSLAGILVLAGAFFLWQTLFVESIGVFTLEIGEINPPGVGKPYDD